MRENNMEGKTNNLNIEKSGDVNNNIISQGNRNKNILTNNERNYYKLKKVINVDENKKNKRPGLKEKEGKIIPFEAMIVGTYRGYSDVLTIINIHSGGKYMADHIQLQLNDSIETLMNNYIVNSSLIRSVGRVYEYKTGDDNKYSIELLGDNKIVFVDDIYYKQHEFPGIYDVDADETYIRIINSRHDDLLKYIEHLRFKINQLTEGFLVNDFIYHYIINQYSLNTLNCDMYHDSLQSNEFDDDGLYKILMLLANVINDLQINETLSLYTIMENISMNLNTVQGILSFDCDRKTSKKVNIEFKKYCEKIGVSFSKGWEMVVNRNKNFDIQEHINQKDLAYKAMVAIGYNIFN